MLNLNETLGIKKAYLIQRDYYLKLLICSIISIIFIELLRKQVVELNLLQLVPGFYVLLLCLLLFFLSTSSTIFVLFPTILFDAKKGFGTKTGKKVDLLTIFKRSFLFSITTLFIILNNIIQLSLDTFAGFNYGVIENIWSIDELVNTEGTLTNVLALLSQIPIIGLLYFRSEIDIKKLPGLWKIVVLVSVIVAGIATPTVDGYTQSAFALVAVILYLIIIFILEKRMTSKFVGTNSLTN
ncbi:MAG: hypothetical protein NXI18_16170 [Alphaproteobacteria bacterium]|nr:hypothetical protein [Alphaproteobacteria bacterium]